MVDIYCTGLYIRRGKKGKRYILGSFHNQGSLVANGHFVCIVPSVLSVLLLPVTFFLAIIWDKVIILDEIGRWMCCLFCMYVHVCNDF